MTEREAFKFGFLLRCAEEGLDGPATLGRAKRADIGDKLWDAGKATLGALGGKAVQLGTSALPVSFFGGLLGGGALGYLGGRLTDPGYDADDVRRQELISAYQQAADDMDEDLRTREELGRSSPP